MFVPLHVHSPFSFLDGASSIRELVEAAARYDMPALAITDHHNVSAAVKFYRLARAAGIKPIQGAEVEVEGGHLVLLAEGPRGYANLCRLLTAAHLQHPRGKPRVSWADLERYQEGLIALSGCRRGEIPRLLLAHRYGEAEAVARRFRELMPGRFFLELQGNLLPREMALNRALAQLAEHLEIGLVATGNVHYVDRADFPVHDLLTCVRTLTRVEDVHPARPLNAENYLRSPSQMEALFGEWLQALHNTGEIAARCSPVFREEEVGRGGRGAGRLHPRFPLPEGVSAAEFLRARVYEGAQQRYGLIHERIRRRLDHELDVICRLGFEEYFLLVWDVARHARERGIRYAGRGSAADSAVAYCLFITGVDSIRRGLLFERFLSPERAEKPDIDIDFDARYRDEITRYVYEKYGSDHVASVATYNTFGARAAVRDLGKALGFPPEELDRLAKRLPYYLAADDLDRAFRTVPELRDSGLDPGKYRVLIDACRRVAGFPRHLGTHLGGVVISGRPLVEITPLQMAAKGVTIVQFDKDDVEDLGLVKLDLLCLRTMGAVEEASRMMAAHKPGFDFDSIPPEDRTTFEMINRGETIGVFQLESPAQRALQARLGASRQEDLVASVALIRPGPIKGNMVEPFIARRQGKEPASYLHPALKPILEKTYGVVLFQEQVIEIATAVAGFTPGEADRLRRVMTHARSEREMEDIGRHFVSKAQERGVSDEVARAIFAQIAGYASYGFCEAHAAAFADLAYKTAYLACHYPAEFYAAILTMQPMGYYPAETIVTEVRRRGISVLPPDINRSEDRFTVEMAGGSPAIRASLRAVKGMAEKGLYTILEARKQGLFLSFPDFCRRVPPGTLGRDVIENLILCGAFDSLEPNRRLLMWRWAGEGGREEAGWRQPEPHQPEWRKPEWRQAEWRQPEWAPVPPLRDYTLAEKLMWEREVLGFAVSGHPMSILRPRLQGQGYVSTLEAKRLPAGKWVKVAGLAVRPHRPPTKSGRIIVYLSLEDEFGLLDLTVFEDVYDRYGRYLFGEAVLPLKAGGTLQRKGETVSLNAAWIVPV